MREFDRDTTSPICIDPRPTHTISKINVARGTRDQIKPPTVAIEPGLELISPSGVEGYIAGKALDGSGLWVFVIKQGQSVWDHSAVEMSVESLRGFKTKDGRVVR